MHYPLRKSDVICQRYKGSGPGGQHRNKTETGIRLVHQPTGTRVEVCNERSLSANLDAAWKMLQAKLDRLVSDRQSAKRQAAYNAKPDASFSAQIRSYILCGQRRVVDHRTGHESPSPDAVLRGQIDPFLMASLRAEQAVSDRP